jgi:hypothetical protein
MGSSNNPFNRIKIRCIYHAGMGNNQQKNDANAKGHVRVPQGSLSRVRSDPISQKPRKEP